MLQKLTHGGLNNQSCAAAAMQAWQRTSGASWWVLSPCVPLAGSHLNCYAWHLVPCYLKECGMLGHAGVHSPPRLMCAVSKVEHTPGKTWPAAALLLRGGGPGALRCSVMPHQHPACRQHARASSLCYNSKAYHSVGSTPASSQQDSDQAGVQPSSATVPEVLVEHPDCAWHARAETMCRCALW